MDGWVYCTLCSETYFLTTDLKNCVKETITNCLIYIAVQGKYECSQCLEKHYFSNK